MNAGSVLAGAVTTLLFALPMTSCSSCLRAGGVFPRDAAGWRWLSIFIVLATAFFPIYVTVLAFLLKPGDPAVGQMMQVSSQVIKLRFLLPGLSFLLMAFISLRFARSHPAASACQSCRSLIWVTNTILK